MIRTAVVLAGGLGTRMHNAIESDALNDKEKELVKKGLKGMIRGLDNRPIFDTTLHNLIEAGIKRIIFVVNNIGGDIIKEHYGDKIGKVKVSYAIQPEPLGTANAVYAAKDAVGNDSFIIMFYDNVYSTQAIKLLMKTKGEWGAVGYDRNALENPELSNFRKEKIRQCAVMAVDKDYYLIEIIERPGDKQDDYIDSKGRILVNMGLFAFDKRVFDCCTKIEPVERHPGKKEYEIQPVVQYGVDNLGIKFKVEPLYDGVMDLTALEDIPSAKEFTRNRKLGF
jgi:glucose-1-phosphate thymidylyltransferase